MKELRIGNGLRMAKEQITVEFILPVARLGILAFGVTLFLALLGALGLGALVGIYRRDHTDKPSEQVSFVVNSMLGLLAFILGLTLVMSHGRYEELRETTFQEANAIGTAWQWTHAVAHPRATTIAGLLEDYLGLRTAFVGAEPGNTEAIAAIERRTDVLQGEIWGHAMVIARERTDPIAWQLLASLNETFDTTTRQRWAYTGAVLTEVFWLVIACSVLTIAGIGYQFGMEALRRPVVVLGLIAMHAAVTAVIFDLATPRLGSLRADTRPYEWTRESLRGGVSIPALSY